jgi:SAM-dependent methyltransferase
MSNPSEQDLLDAWNQRWRESVQGEKLTLLGRAMFRAKLRTITAILETITCDSVIEVGCGLGHTLALYQGLGYQVIGIDPSVNAIQICESRSLPCKRLRLDQIDESFDLVSSDGMLEHFLHFEPYAEDMMRISKHYVLLIQPNHGSFIGKTLVYLAELLRGDINMFEYNYRISDFISVFDQHGFACLENRPAFMDCFRVLLFARRNTT